MFYVNQQTLYVKKIGENMPTFINNKSYNIKAVDISGNNIIVAPTESFTTFSYDVDANFTKTSDTPMWNRVKNRQTITATGVGAIVAISVKTQEILIEKISDSISVFIQEKTNTPAWFDSRIFDDLYIFLPVKGRCDQLVITGTGTCDIVEYI